MKRFLLDNLTYKSLLIKKSNLSQKIVLEKKHYKKDKNFEQNFYINLSILLLLSQNIEKKNKLFIKS